MVDRRARNTFSKSDVQQKDGGYLATEYLLDHGHRRIACMVNTASPSTDAQRLRSRT